MTQPLRDMAGAAEEMARGDYAPAGRDATRATRSASSPTPFNRMSAELEQRRTPPPRPGRPTSPTSSRRRSPRFGRTSRTCSTASSSPNPETLQVMLAAVRTPRPASSTSSSTCPGSSRATSRWTASRSRSPRSSTRWSARSRWRRRATRASAPAQPGRGDLPRVLADSRARAPGAVQPARQRGAVHAARRPVDGHRGRGATGGARSRWQTPARGSRRPPAVRVRTLLPGRPVAARGDGRRDRHRPRHRAFGRRGARRDRSGPRASRGGGARSRSSCRSPGHATPSRRRTAAARGGHERAHPTAPGGTPGRRRQRDTGGNREVGDQHDRDHAAERFAWVDLTDELRRAIKDSGVTDGMAVAFCRHTTCALIDQRMGGRRPGRLPAAPRDARSRRRLLRPRRHGAPHPEPPRVPRAAERPRRTSSRCCSAATSHVDPGGRRRADVRPLAAAAARRARRAEGTRVVFHVFGE